MKVQADARVPDTVRVVVVSESPQVWGAERSLLILLEEMSSNDMSFTVLVSAKSPLRERLEVLGIECAEHKFATSNVEPLYDPGRRTASVLRMVRTAVRIPKSVARLRSYFKDFDLVVGFSLWQCPEVLLASRLSGTPFIVDLHETIGGALGTRVASLVCTRAQKCISVSNWVANRYEMPAGRYTVVPRPVESAGADTVGLRKTIDDVVRIGIFGQIEEHKRPKEVVAAFASVENPDVELLIVGGSLQEQGRSTYEESLRCIAETDDRIQIHARVDDVVRLMASCEFVLNFSQHEAFGRTMIEALSVGSVPVCVTDSGPAEVVSASGGGIVLDSDRGLREWLDSLSVGGVRHLFERDECAARVEASRGYSPEVIGRRYKNELTTVLGRLL